VSENRELRRIFGPRREEVAGGCRRLHNEELHDLCASPNIIRVIMLRRMGEIKNAYKILIGKPEEKKLLGRPRRRWEVNIRIDLAEIWWENVYWIHLAQDRD
jgi:hypothetical protein